MSSTRVFLGRLRSPFVLFLAAVLLAAHPSVAPDAPDPFFVFRPIDARGTTPEDRTRIEAKWNALPGMTPEISRALTDYEMAPGMGTAIGVLEHYQTFSKSEGLRAAFHAADPQVFLTLDAAKYELVMQTQAAMKRDGRDIGYAMRVGSSGERQQLWLRWAAGGRDLRTVPPWCRRCPGNR